MNFEGDVVIGLEIHVQLNTKTKLFCGCTTTADKPNSATCPVCLGHPGSKPVLNQQVVEWATLLSLALGCTINKEVQFSRKTYFYPDMSKNYQISQFEVPLAQGGHVILDNGTQVRVRRLHMEEDPAALVYPEGTGTSKFVLVDYNRSGIPLVEIVTEPDMSGPDEAREFVKKILHVLAYLKIFDENNGVIKADANVSIKESGYTRVEIKNITGAKEIERALHAEVDRQRKEFKNNEKIVLETRGWDPVNGVTRHQRTKEEEADYGYIIDPDLPTIMMTETRVDALRANVPELGQEKQKRFVEKYRIDAVDASVMVKERELGELFERLAEQVDPVLAARWMRRELRRVLSEQDKRVADVDEKLLVELLSLLEKKIITDRIGQKLMVRLVAEGISPKDVVDKEGLAQVSDEGTIKPVVERVVKEFPEAVEEYKNGENKAFNYLVGQCMRELKGKGSPQLINKLLKEVLE